MSRGSLKSIFFLGSSISEQSINAVQRVNICINVNREGEKKAKKCHLVLPN